MIQFESSGHVEVDEELKLLLDRIAQCDGDLDLATMRQLIANKSDFIKFTQESNLTGDKEAKAILNLIEESKIEARNRPEQGKPLKKASSVQIVIADDDVIFRDGLRRLLEAEPGFEVVGEASDGDQALLLAHFYQPDVLLLDLDVPSVLDFDALRELALERVGPKTKIIVLVAATLGRIQMVKALEMGVHGVVMKEAATQFLWKAVHAVMSGQCWIGSEAVANSAKAIRLYALSVRLKQNYGLTAREMEIVTTIVGGLSVQAIARKFSISEETAKRALEKIFQKVGVSNRSELTRFAVDNPHLGQKEN